MFFVPLAEWNYGDQCVLLDLTGYRMSSPGENLRVRYDYSLLAFAMLIGALNLVTIFMYKRRVLQMRLCVYNILLLAGITGVILFTLHGIIKEVESLPRYCLPLVFPVVAAILHYLAFRGIRKDELMVQAMSRLR
jgi:peptidoglycan/LPS O-acetylase OafA/YrhL